MSHSVTIVRRGLELPLSGEPEQRIEPSPAVARVGVLTRDHVGLKPRLSVEEGAAVRLGEPLFTDRRWPEVRWVAPGGGVVEAVHRGEKRHVLSVVVRLDPAAAEPVTFAAFSPRAKDSGDAARALLLEAGLWPCLRTRPFSQVPGPASKPLAVFVTALDTQPHAPRLDVALAGREADLELGLHVLTRLTDGPVWLCRAQGATLSAGGSGARVAEFGGPHPAGTAGFHIHTLRPVTRGHEVWHLGAQDAVRIGRLFSSGALDVEHVISLAGPLVKRPRLVRTRLHAEVAPLVEGELHPGEARVVSGSALHGDRCDSGPHGFLGRFHQQLSVLAEGRRRELLGWLAPGARAFSVLPAFLSAVLPKRRFGLDTNLHGGRRAMVPIGMYERVMPMDLMTTHLLRALQVGDVEWAEQLGALELDEEDLALCSFVCPGKGDYGAALRRVLDTLQAEG
ncbi:MAG: Na(+)-translocating NADH-quinone reductase subunit A [Myxococcaceae bacterium]|nr:Na(+)-translocating NADH-quinone reductase subunit A [Myxococcaceae bacterium]